MLKLPEIPACQASDRMQAKSANFGGLNKDIVLDLSTACSINLFKKMVIGGGGGGTCTACSARFWAEVRSALACSSSCLR